MCFTCIRISMQVKHYTTPVNTTVFLKMDETWGSKHVENIKNKKLKYYFKKCAFCSFIMYNLIITNTKILRLWSPIPVWLNISFPLGRNPKIEILDGDWSDLHTDWQSSRVRSWCHLARRLSRFNACLRGIVRKEILAQTANHIPIIQQITISYSQTHTPTDTYVELCNRQTAVEYKNKYNIFFHVSTIVKERTNAYVITFNAEFLRKCVSKQFPLISVENRSR